MCRDTTTHEELSEREREITSAQEHSTGGLPRAEDALPLRGTRRGCTPRGLEKC